MENKLQRRDCAIRIRLVPYGAGWSDVYLDIEGDSHYFIISHVMGSGEGIAELLRCLYFLHPDNDDPDYSYGYIDEWLGELENGEIVRVLPPDTETGKQCLLIPHTEFEWDEEGAYSHWCLERMPSVNDGFNIRLRIDHNGTNYEYTVPYRELCYAVAKTCTEVLKSHGIYGYHYSVYTSTIPLHHLLFVKGVALGDLSARKLVHGGRGEGSSTSLEKELELLLFDM